MRYNRLGQSGLVVSELCLGAMTFGTAPSAFFQHDLDQAGSTALVKQALDAGVNFIDTANVYSLGQSEQFTGQALRDLGIARDRVVIATKGMGPMGEGPNDGGYGRVHLLHQIDASLARLGLDHVDLYQIHGWDPHTPMEEGLRALEDIVRSGRARYVGVSNWAARSPIGRDSKPSSGCLHQLRSPRGATPSAAAASALNPRGWSHVSP